MPTDEIVLPELTGPQLEFFESLSSRSAFIAGVGSGKTHVLILSALYMACVHEGLPGAILFPTFVQWEDIGLPKWQELVPEDLYSYHPKAGKIFMANGSTIYTLGVKSALKRIRGYNWAWAFMDEAGPERDANAVKMIGQRIRVGDPRRRRLGVLTSPAGHQWLEAWCSAGVHVVRASTYDNPYLDADYLRQLEIDFPPGSREHRQEMLGEFVSITGRVYGEVFALSDHTVPWEGTPGDRYVLTVDPGYRASAWLVWQYRLAPTPQWVVVGEYLPEDELTETTAERIKRDRGREPEKIFMDTPSKQNSRLHINDADALRSVFRRSAVRVLGGYERSSDWRHKAVISGLSSGSLKISQRLIPARVLSTERGVVHALQHAEWPSDSTRDERRDEKERLKHVIDALEFGAAVLTPAKLGRSIDRAKRSEANKAA